MRNRIYIYLLLFTLVAASCGKFRQYEKNPDWRVKYEAGMNYYAKKEYYKASSLFEQIIPIVRGLPEGEKVQFYLAYCQYHQKLYLLSSEQFRTFYETYGRSQFVEEARFMYAYSLYVSSPSSNLDQSNSIQSMAAMQEFLNRYPGSSFGDQANEVISTSQQKLEQKGFDNAYQYFKMRQYKAAIVSFQNFKNNFPDTHYQEEADFLIFNSQFNLAEQSYYFKQEERYKEVVTYYKEFIDQYPKSERLRDAEKIYTQSLEKLTRFKNTNF